MNLAQRIILLWRRFSPLEERLLAAVREVLPAAAVPVFDAQVAAVTLVQRHPHEICFYRRRHGKVDWSGVPTFPRTGEFPLAEVRFPVAGRGYKATLSSISGHFFDFSVTANTRKVAFKELDSRNTLNCRRPHAH